MFDIFFFIWNDDSDSFKKGLLSDAIVRFKLYITMIVIYEVYDNSKYGYFYEHLKLFF